MLFIRSIKAWICQIIVYMGGCLGCCSLPPYINSAKGVRGQHRAERKPSILEDFWSTTSTYEMDHGVQSQSSLSLICTSNLTLDPHSKAGSTSNPTQFVNHGFLLWTQIREQWVGSKKPENRPQEGREPRLSWNATYDSLLGTNKPFVRPVPLSEMVDFLVDIWEQEGMYD